jgi:phage gp36-like protein
MTYAVLQDLIDRYGASEIIQLSDRDGDGAPDAVVCAKALQDATDVIDGYVGGRYQLPLSPVPGNVSRICSDIARFYLWKDQASDAVMALYKAATAMLTGIQAGSITLESASVDSALTGDAVGFVSGTRTFSPSSLSGF